MPQIGTGGSMFITGAQASGNPSAPPAPIIPWAGGVPYGSAAGAINTFMNSQALNAYNQNLPGYANAVGQRMGNTQSMLEGELPQDVVNQIAQQSAERGIAGGQAGGPNSNAAYLRALGLNSLDMQMQGSQQLSQAIGDTPVPELWNPASLWVPTVLGQQEAAAARSAINLGNSASRTGTGTGVPAAPFNFEAAYQSRFGRPSYSFL